MKQSRFTETQIVAILDQADAQERIERWRVDYNRCRPHSAPGDRTPEEFKAAMEEAG